MKRAPSARKWRNVVGLMSGTSADGIDAALVQIDGCGAGTVVEVLAFVTVPLSSDLRVRVFDLFNAKANIDELCLLNFALGEAFAGAALEVIEAAGLTADQVDLIGSHGQTVRHLPSADPPSTLQIGEPAVIAQQTGITTIADFRPADMAVGGQGAPLVPLADQLLFSHPQHGRLLLNVGGIANVTYLPAGDVGDHVRAFDVGPGNALIDAAVMQASNGVERFDRDGAAAARGHVDDVLLKSLLTHDFLEQVPPKSTGRETFGEDFCRQLRDRTNLAEDDFVATLTAFSVLAIADGLRRFVPPGNKELLVGGGGVHNRELMRQLANALPELRVAPLGVLGIDPDAREAVSFAVLANETVNGRTGNLTTATGAKRSVILGKITPVQRSQSCIFN